MRKTQHANVYTNFLGGDDDPLEVPLVVPDVDSELPDTESLSSSGWPTGPRLW